MKKDIEIVKIVFTSAGETFFLNPETYLADSLVLVYLYYLSYYRN